MEKIELIQSQFCWSPYGRGDTFQNEEGDTVQSLEFCGYYPFSSPFLSVGKLESKGEYWRKLLGGTRKGLALTSSLGWGTSTVTESNLCFLDAAEGQLITHPRALKGEGRWKQPGAAKEWLGFSCTPKVLWTQRELRTCPGNLIYQPRPCFYLLPCCSVSWRLTSTDCIHQARR